YKGKVRVMAIMTGVQSAQILGPTTQKQANRSKEAMGEAGADNGIADPAEFDASENVGSEATGDGWADGGTDETTETKNGLDVIRTN
ncbi:MAG: cell division protein FtsZ, partial [Halorientalis sp.]